MACVAFNTNNVFVVGLLSLLLLIQKNNAFEFRVDWSVASASYDKWAERNRFQIGDTLLFNYQAGQDSVLQVTKDDYNGCNTAAPIAKYGDDGHTVVKLDQSGPHYFISGVVQHCKSNKKVVVVVMADRTGRSSPSHVLSPSPAPAAEEPLSPPPAPATQDLNPTSAPSDEYPPPPPPNGASLTVGSFLFSVGAFVGSSFLFVF